MDEIDIWRAAQQLIRMYGDDAEFAASQRADNAIDQGDPRGERVWISIMRAVMELQRDRPVGSFDVN